MPSFARVAEQHVQTVPHGNLNGVWQKAVEGFTRVAGVWRQFYLASGANDSTFTEFDTSNKANNAVFASAVQPDGKIILVGAFTLFNGATANGVVRLNTNGSVDTSFGTGTGLDNFVNAIAIQSDGKIILGGSFTAFNGTTATRIVRLNTNGTVDTTFNTGTGANGTVLAIAIQSDGKIILGGGFLTFNGTTANRIVRLNTNGTIDTTFGTGANNAVNAIAIQSDGKLIIGGFFTLFNGTTANRIVRLNTNGSVDTTFGTGANNAVNAIAIQSDGRIVLGGRFTLFNGTTANRIVRLNTNVSVDTAFGTGANFETSSIAVQPDGKLIIGGQFTLFNGATATRIVRLNTNGTVDTTFNTGTGANNTVNAIAIQSDGKIILSGQFTLFNGLEVNRVVGFNSNGTQDETLATVVGANSPVTGIAVQSDGKIILGGGFSTFNGTTANRIVRLNTNGSVDTSFGTGTGLDDFVNAIAIQSDGKIILGGNFTLFNGATANRVVRLNTNGSVDTTFGTGANNTVLAIAIQSDGKIILGGNFTLFNGATANRVVRLNTNGSVDTTFGTGANSTVNAIAIQSDGKIILGGNFTLFNGATANRVVRLNTNGSVDTTFGTGANFETRSIAVQPDEKLIIGGQFTLFNGTTANGVVRLNTNGSVDTTFGTGANFETRSIAVQPDGKLIIGGQFTLFNGTTAKRIVRLNTNGTVDTTFNTGTGADNTVLAIAVQSDGKIIIGGSFIGFNEINRSFLARIGGDLAI